MGKNATDVQRKDFPGTLGGTPALGTGCLDLVALVAALLSFSDTIVTLAGKPTQLEAGKVLAVPPNQPLQISSAGPVPARGLRPRLWRSRGRRKRFASSRAAGLRLPLGEFDHRARH